MMSIMQYLHRLHSSYAPQQLLLLPFVALVPDLTRCFKEVLLKTGFGRLDGFFENGYLLQTGFFQARSHTI